MNNFKSGMNKAHEDMRQPNFNTLAAICAFDGSPAQTVFQHGYLYALLCKHQGEYE